MLLNLKAKSKLILRDVLEKLFAMGLLYFRI